MAQSRKNHRPQTVSQPVEAPIRWRYKKLASTVLETLANNMKTTFRWGNMPRPFQLSISQAQLEGVDAIAQAATGAGKTAAVAGPHLLAENMCTIFVSPLLQLQDEMVRFPPNQTTSDVDFITV